MVAFSLLTFLLYCIPTRCSIWFNFHFSYSVTWIRDHLASQIDVVSLHTFKHPISCLWFPFHFYYSFCLGFGYVRGHATIKYSLVLIRVFIGLLFAWIVLVLVLLYVLVLVFTLLLVCFGCRLIFMSLNWYSLILLYVQNLADIGWGVFVLVRYWGDLYSMWNLR